LSKIIKIDPLTRVEGHLGVSVNVKNNIVDSAQISGMMYRGFERLLEGRSPMDAARIAQRVCGICHEVHGVASVRALEKLYGVSAPLNGRVLQDLILGLHLVVDHLTHFYSFVMPDYVDFEAVRKYKGTAESVNKIKEWVKSPSSSFIKRDFSGRLINDTDTVVKMVSNYMNVVRIKSKAGSGIAIIGAKTPFAHAVMPGGITTEITFNVLSKYLDALDAVSSFVNNEFYEDVTKVASDFKEYFRIGKSYNNFYSSESFGEFYKPLFKEGVYLEGKIQNFDHNKVEYIDGSSFYSADGSPDEDAEGAYSWTKVLRYQGRPLEVGPTARLIINKDEEFKKILNKFGTADNTSSTMTRIVARMVESKRIIEKMYELINMYKLGERTINEVDLSKKVTGYADYSGIAARGALSHKISAEKGKILKYEMVVPSTWNFGPSGGGYEGVVEKALKGCSVIDEKASKSPDVVRTIRSFDPCTACAVH